MASASRVGTNQLPRDRAPTHGSNSLANNTRVQRIAMPFLLIAFTSVLAASPEQIDARLMTVQRSSNVEPAKLCDDQTFLRRVSLDLIGRIPTVEELDTFLVTPDRQAKIDTLLEHPKFSRRVAEVWTAALVGFTRETPADRIVLLQWLEDQLASHRSFKEIVTAIVTAEGQSAIDGPVNFIVRHGEDGAVQISRQFLGIRLDCARCHDHPFAKWTQDDFAAMSRFFESVRMEEVTEGNIRVRSSPMRASDEQAPGSCPVPDLARHNGEPSWRCSSRAANRLHETSSTESGTILWDAGSWILRTTSIRRTNLHLETYWKCSRTMPANTILMCTACTDSFAIQRPTSGCRVVTPQRMRCVCLRDE